MHEGMAAEGAAAEMSSNTQPVRAQKSRQSNFELLRILAMLMIVAHHMVRFASPGLEPP